MISACVKSQRKYLQLHDIFYICVVDCFVQRKLKTPSGHFMTIGLEREQGADEDEKDKKLLTVKQTLGSITSL